jgi:hypothetical protein
VILLLGFVVFGRVSANPEVDPIRAENLKQVDAWFAEAKAMAATNEHLQVLPRVLIDTQNATVTFKAEATGLSPNEIMEFFLVSQESGNTYEAAAVALAEPIHIANAIKMLGLKPGLPVDMAALRFWPQGERVHLYFNEYHASQLMLDERTGKPPARNGFVFTASDTTQKNGETILSAQVTPPYSIAANYNESKSILDVPFQAPQSAVYSFQIQNPEHSFPAGELITIRIEPEHKDGTQRVQLLTLYISATNTAATAEVDQLLFSLRPQDETNKIIEQVPIETLLMHLQKMANHKQDAFAEVHLDKKLSLSQVHITARLIDNMEQKDGLRVRPPPPDALYYKAFIPNEELRVRDQRISQPWELHLAHDKKPTLVWIQEEWIQGQLRPNLTIQEISIAPEDDLSAKMKELRPEMNAVFVYAPKDMSLGRIMSTIRRFHNTHPFIHVFMED